MKKYLNISLFYAIAAMVGGVFYREFTKFNGFDSATALGKVHTHLFILGMIVFLIVALFVSRNNSVPKHKCFKAFMVTYNTGVILTAIMMLARGTIQVLGIGLAKGIDAAISGVAGIGHILTGAGIILLLLSLIKTAKN